MGTAAEACENGVFAVARLVQLHGPHGSCSDCMRAMQTLRPLMPCYDHVQWGQSRRCISGLITMQANCRSSVSVKTLCCLRRRCKGSVRQAVVCSTEAMLHTCCCSSETVGDGVCMEWRSPTGVPKLMSYPICRLIGVGVGVRSAAAMVFEFVVAVNHAGYQCLCF